MRSLLSLHHARLTWMNGLGDLKGGEQHLEEKYFLIKQIDLSAWRYNFDCLWFVSTPGVLFVQRIFFCYSTSMVMYECLAMYRWQREGNKGKFSVPRARGILDWSSFFPFELCKASRNLEWIMKAEPSNYISWSSKYISYTETFKEGRITSTEYKIRASCASKRYWTISLITLT